MEPLLREVFDLLALDHAPITHERNLCDPKSGRSIYQTL
jgi:hypothetical protein